MILCLRDLPLQTYFGRRDSRSLGGVPHRPFQASLGKRLYFDTGVRLYCGIKGLPSPVAGHVTTLAVDEWRLCHPSRPTAPSFHQQASRVDGVISFPA